MSHLSEKQEQQKQQETLDSHCSMYENSRVEHQPLSQELSRMSNQSMITSSIINENQEQSSSQQFQDTQVAIHLTDCMQCFVRIPRCQIEEQYSYWDKNSQTLDQQIRERQEEEEKTSQRQLYSQGSSKEEEEEEDEEEFHGEGLEREDFNPLEIYMCSPQQKSSYW